MDLIESMSSRMPWSIAKKIFDKRHVPTKRGWTHTFESLHSAKDDPDILKALPLCTEDYMEHIKYGEKCIRLVEVTNDQSERFSTLIGTLQTEDHPFTNAFPYILDEESLRQIPDYSHHLVHIDQCTNGTHLVFAAKAFVEIRDRIEGNDIPPEVMDTLGALDELITVRRSLRQTFDVVWIPSGQGHIELRADAPKSIPADISYSSLNKLVQALRLAFPTEQLSEPLNLFPIISMLYQNADEGSVVEMDFLTNTASIKREKMRRLGLDLRREIYHMAGYTALEGHISPYRISIRWHQDGSKASPELSLNSSIWAAHAPSPNLYEAEIRWCATKDEFNSITNIIKHYVSLNAHTNT